MKQQNKKLIQNVENSSESYIKDFQDYLFKNKLMTKILLQVHDEFIFSVPKNELNQIQEIIPMIMENVIKLNVPLQVNLSSGANWFELK